MNETQRAAALRLADSKPDFCYSSLCDWADEAAALLRELAAEPVQDEPVAAELPAPQLLVESAQGFVEGWTRSQVRSAINLALLKRRYAAPQQPIRSADIETKDEQHDLHRRSVEIMAKALAYSERMTVAMERIASVATDWRGNAHGITGETT